MHFEDSSTYILPRTWNMEDRPRRTRLYSNLRFLSRHIGREMSLICLMNQRSEFLKAERSKQSRQAVAREMRNLEAHLQMRRAVESEYEALVYDYLGWAIAQFTFDLQEHGKSTISTIDMPPSILKDWIAPTSFMRERFLQLQTIERSHFPERFTKKASLLLQCTPAADSYVRDHQQSRMISRKTMSRASAAISTICGHHECCRGLSSHKNTD